MWLMLWAGGISCSSLWWNGSEELSDSCDSAASLAEEALGFPLTPLSYEVSSANQLWQHLFGHLSESDDPTSWENNSKYKNYHWDSIAISVNLKTVDSCNIDCCLLFKFFSAQLS